MVGDGRLPHGIRIPAERELARHAGISRNTVSAAYNLLRAEGYVMSIRGAGTYIMAPQAAMDRVTSWAPPTASPGVIDLVLAAMPALEPLLSEVATEAIGDLPKYSSEHGYGMLGLTELRDMVANCYRDRGLPTSAANIMITSGVHHAWGLLLRLLTSRNGHVLMENPAYPNAIDAVLAVGRRPVGVGMSPYGWDIELLATVFREVKTQLALLTPEFQNPTGHLMPDSVREAITAMSLDAPIVVDESFIGLALDEPLTPQPSPMAAFGGAVISMGSMSKVFWGGLRIGWIRADRKIIARLVTLRSAIDSGNPVIDQLVALRVLDRQAEVLRMRRTMLLEQRAIAVRALQQWLPEARFTLPSGGLSLWVDLGLPVSTRMSTLASEHRVQIVSGKRFSVDGTHERFIRIPYVLSGAKLYEGIRRAAAAYREALDPQRGTRTE